SHDESRPAALGAPLSSSYSPFFFRCYVHPRALHSFPTRRSSDLMPLLVAACSPGASATPLPSGLSGSLPPPATGTPAASAGSGRSEEHTSELQSRGHIVCRLLLEKKKLEIVFDEGRNSAPTSCSA